MGFFSFFSNQTENQSQKDGKPRKLSFWERFKSLFVGEKKIDKQVLETLEETLLAADVGPTLTFKMIEELEKKVAVTPDADMETLKGLLQEQIIQLLNTKGENITQKRLKPYVILVVGINGVGKTTTVAKLAHHFTQKKDKVIIGAADTFRAAAIDQLQVWGKRIGVPIIGDAKCKDPASVAYDTVKRGIDTQQDVVLIDTAGRLHNKVSLMNELEKIKRVVKKILPYAPQETLLVIDANTGQNVLQQALAFSKAIEVNALAITKLDSMAKGFAVLNIVDALGVPIKYIGTGEKINDLEPFNAISFTKSLF